MRCYIIVLLLSLIVSSCSGEYFDHIQREHAPVMISTGGALSLSGGLYVLPDKKVLENLVEEIDNAKKRIWVEIYTWTEKGTLEAIERAKKRGIDIQVILEGNVYRTPWINNDTVKKLQKSNIPFKYSNNRKYTFSHIKLWIIDDRWCISTGNWSYTSFTSNREFIFCSKDPYILSNFEEIFRSDFSHKTPYFSTGIDKRIGLSPYNGRTWIEENLKTTAKEIIVYNQAITDKKIISLLSEKADTGVSVKICQASKDPEAGEEQIDIMPANIKSYTSKKPYLHAKVFLLDGNRVILGSTNMTQNAIDNNREVLVDLGINPQLYTYIYTFFQKDCIAQAPK